MKEVGIDPAVMAGCYSRVAQSIGLSLDPEDHAAALVCDLAGAQPPLQVDENAEALLASYRRKSKPLNENGFFLGKAPLAVLTRDRERAGILRRACSYHNMDYYSDHGGAVYRLSHTLAELRNEREFEHLRGYLALEFSEKDGRLAVLCRSLADGETMTFQARRVVLAAGALNSARLVLASCRKFGRQLPLLSNEVRFLPSLNLSMLGRPQRNYKCSLAQLVGVSSRSNGDLLISYFFSYDSLLLFRLVREMPFPVRLGHLLARTIVHSLMIATLHFPDRFTRLKWIRVPEPASGAGLPELEAECRLTFLEEEQIEEDTGRLKRHLRRLGCHPLSVINRGSGTAVHYGGTLPFEESGEPFLTCGSDGRLNGTRRVYVADSAPWRFLPAKGLTLTIMANARRVAGEVVKDLQD